MKTRNISKSSLPIYIKTFHDADCPKCGFPETIIVRDQQTMEALWEECSKKTCNWGRKIIKK